MLLFLLLLLLFRTQTYSTTIFIIITLDQILLKIDQIKDDDDVDGTRSTHGADAYKI